MNERMRAACVQLTKLLEADDLATGMYVRVRCDHLIVGRQEHVGMLATVCELMQHLVARYP
jgi:hypothetical protein